MVPLRMGWRHLLFAHYPIPVEVMTSQLPGGLEPDVYDGSAWLSIVPFTNVAVRPEGVPASLGLRVPELNVRTYVTHDGVPSVYFFSLDAQSIATVIGARLFHHLPYFYARMSLERENGRVRFTSRRRHPGARPATFTATYWPTGEPFAAHEDPLTKFLTERYRFYTYAQDESLRYTDVIHDEWTLYPANAKIDTNTLWSTHGFRRPAADPVYHCSPGLNVTATRSARSADVSTT